MTEPGSETPSPPPPPARRARRRRRVLWHGLRAGLWLLALPVIFVVVAAVLLFDTEVAAPAWLTARIEARAGEMLGGGTLTFAGMTVSVGPDLHPRVRMTGAVLRDADGRVLVQAGDIAGQVSPRGLLFARAVLLQEVTLSGVEVALARAADGSVAVSFGRGAGPGAQAPDMARLIDRMDGVFDLPALAALEEIAVTGLIVNYADARAGRNWTVDGAVAQLDLRGGRTRIDAQLALLSGGAGVTALALSFDSPRDARTAEMSVTIENARTQDIAAQSAALNWLTALDAGLTATLRTSLDETGDLGPLHADLDLGAGVLQPTPQTAPLAFDEARVALTFTPATDIISFRDLAVRSDWGQVRGSGQAILQDYRAGLPQVLVGQIMLSDLALNPDGIYPQPVALAGAQADVRLRLAPFTLDIGQVVTDDPALPVTARGQVRATPEGWEAEVDLTSPTLDAAQVMALWPEGVRARLRDWLAANVSAARLSDIAVALRLPAGEKLRLGFGAAFADTSVRFLPQMPPITGAAGYMTLGADAFSLSVDTGAVTAPQGGTLDIAGSSLRIPDLRVRPRELTIALTGASTATAALALLDAEPLRLMQKAGRPVTLADGRAQVNAAIAFPLKDGLRGGDVTFDATAEIARVRSTQVVPGRTLAAPRLQLAADNAGLSVAGAGTLDGVPFDGTFTQVFGPGLRADVEARVTLSDATLRSFGIRLPPGSVGGEGRGQLAIALRGGQAPRYAVRSDLRGLSVALPPVGWAKPRDAAGTLRVEGALGPVPTVEVLSIGGGGLQAEGAVRLGAGGAFDSAQFSRVRIGDWLNAPVTLRGRGAGRAPAVAITGGTLDLRGAQFGSGGGEGGPLDLALDRLQITEGIGLTGFTGQFDGAGGFSGQFAGRVNGGPQVRGTVVPQNGRSAVRIVSEDAGGVARAAGFLRNGLGGTLDLVLRPAAGPGTFDGTLAIRALRVQDAPAIAALLDAISVVGLLQQLDGQGLAFDAVDAQFRLTPRQVIVAQASAVGPGLGISLDGIYTLASRSFDFQGVVSPFYLVNAIGSLLTRPGEGLIGFNFTVTGAGNAPQVSVNPLSVFTPGMFREIFRRPPPELTR